ncbi:MAG TPA: diacylglycerol kinase family protein [Chloroflexota bacterium]|nr:diacylglycerol kinase family protein [Chloroflexota bacterium]
MIGALVNPRSGYVARHGVDQVRAMLGEVVPDARIEVIQPHDDIAAWCRDLLSTGATCIAAVGGDGTIGSAAAALVDTGVPLGVIPGGTLNHFARDVGVGRDVHQALRTLAEGQAIPVDVATVNDHVYLNNSSIGLYPAMVQLRKAEEQRLGRMRAMIRAGLIAVGRRKWSDVHIETGDHRDRVRTQLLLVANNQFEHSLRRLGVRKSLQEGFLSCYVLDAPTRLKLIETIVPSLLRDQPDTRFFRSLRATELTVVPEQEREVDVSADGEVFVAKTPLVYRIRPGALQVLVPRTSASTQRGSAWRFRHSLTSRSTACRPAPIPT